MNTQFHCGDSKREMVRLNFKLQPRNIRNFLTEQNFLNRTRWIEQDQIFQVKELTVLKDWGAQQHPSESSCS